MKRPYLFGYLFVKVAKALALLLVLTGIGFCVVEYSQAEASAGAATYQPSASLLRSLGKLGDALGTARRIVADFNLSDSPAAALVSERPPHFPALINSNADFNLVGETLQKIDQERQQLKQSIVSRFENSTKTIEERLRAYATELKAQAQPSPARSQSSVATPTPGPHQSRADQESLFSSSLTSDEIARRAGTLTRQRAFLQLLEAKAENPQNRARLSEAAKQLGLLIRLLQATAGADGQAEPAPPAASPEDESATEPIGKVFLAERVGSELARVRGDVRQIVLTSWTLDDTFEQVNDLTATEREKCRVSILKRKEIWLAATSKILTGLLIAVFGSFLILACADLLATFLDTAEHTGVVAEAINALRGSVVTRRGDKQTAVETSADASPNGH